MSLSRRILIVEPSRDTADSLAALLRLHGHEVRTAATPDQAFEEADGFAPDLLFLEIVLKEDAFELGRTLRAIYDCQVVVLTGYRTQDTAFEARLSGFDTYLLKPTCSERILQIVDGETSVSPTPR